MDKMSGIPVITLPWPPRELSPNARGHWATKSRAAKKYRTMCHLMALQSKIVAATEGEVLLDLTFCPPDRRRHDDDNCLAAFKAGRDGLADALGIDDNRFVTTFRKGEPVPGGVVLVRVASGVSA